MSVVRSRLEGLLLWRVWERMRLGMRGDALTTAREALASADDVRKATGLLGLVLTVFFANSFTTALQRVYLRAWRRPSHPGASSYWRGAVWLLVLVIWAITAHGRELVTR